MNILVVSLRSCPYDPIAFAFAQCFCVERGFSHGSDLHLLQPAALETSVACLRLLVNGCDNIKSHEPVPSSHSHHTNHSRQPAARFALMVLVLLKTSSFLDSLTLLVLSALFLSLHHVYSFGQQDTEMISSLCDEAQVELEHEG